MYHVGKVFNTWLRVGLTLKLAAAIGCGGSGPGVAAPPEGTPPATAPTTCVAGSAAFPRPLELPGTEPNGVFDPNLARDPETGRLWMAYSGVTGPAGSGLVSTHLAFSDDDGLTWCGGGAVNQAATVPPEEQPPRLAMPNGHWSHEVAAIARDPGAPPEERWRLVWHRYLHIEDSDPDTDDRRFEHGWIAQRTAATAEGLRTAPEGKLFSSAAYHATPNIEAYNDAVLGVAPEKRFDRDPDLGSCLAFTEPGMIAFGGDLYVALFCFRAASEQDIVLVRLTHATGGWAYVGTLLTTRDATPINPALVGFNAADLLSVGGTHRLLVSPTVGSAYLGCLDYEVDLPAATLRDIDGNGPDPLHAVPKNPDPGVYQTGACTYDEHSPLGLIVGDTYLSGVQFRLVATGDPL